MRLKIFAGIALLVVIGIAFYVGTTLHQSRVASGLKLEGRIERRAAGVNYRNSLEGCEGRGNEGRENQLTLALILANQERPGGPAQGVVHGIRSAPYSRNNGSIDCTEAIEKP